MYKIYRIQDLKYFSLSSPSKCETCTAWIDSFDSDPTSKSNLCTLLRYIRTKRSNAGHKNTDDFFETKELFERFQPFTRARKTPSRTGFATSRPPSRAESKL